MRGEKLVRAVAFAFVSSRRTTQTTTKCQHALVATAEITKAHDLPDKDDTNSASVVPSTQFSCGVSLTSIHRAKLTADRTSSAVSIMPLSEQISRQGVCRVCEKARRPVEVQMHTYRIYEQYYCSIFFSVAPCNRHAHQTRQNSQIVST